MTDKPKVTLTRQAAADMLRRHTLEGHSNIDNMINFYVEAGMLEVVEESSLEGLPIGFAFPYSKRIDWAECCRALYDQGYMIIKS